MEFHQLRYFVAVSEAGSFSKGAERCHVAQPSLSQQIKKLERDLGQPLFDRLPTGVALTEAGKALLPRARDILTAINDAGQAVRQDLEEGTGPLAVGVIPTMAPYLLPPVLGDFLATYPACDLSVREDLTDRLVEYLTLHEIDVAVMSTPVDHSQIELEVVGEEQLLLMCREDSPLHHPSPVTLRELLDQPAIVVHEIHCLGQQIRDFCSAHRVAMRVVCRGAQLSTVQQLVDLGLGVSLVPEMAARSDAGKPDRYHPMKTPAPRREIAVAWHRQRTQSRLARRFVELLRENLAAGRHRFPA